MVTSATSGGGPPDGGIGSRAVRLHHVRDGAGAPLLLLHGIGMSGRVWEQVTPALAADFACYAVDLPGFGRSAPLAGPPTMRALARACAAFMAAQGHERFHVAGNSLGGGIALHLALDGTARSACALSPVGFLGGWDRPYLHASLAAIRAAAPVLAAAAPVIARPPALRRALLAQYAAHGERLTVDDVVAGFGDLVAATGFGATRRHAINWRCPSIARLPCPVTVAWGEQDRLLPYRPQARRAQARLPGARHVALPGIGHLPTWDDPARVAELVRDAASAG